MRWEQETIRGGGRKYMGSRLKSGGEVGSPRQREAEKCREITQYKKGKKKGANKK